MTDIKIKLNDIVSERQITHKQRTPIHILNNSIKRNTINHSAHSHLTYDCKLPHLKMSKRQISNMLKYLLSKLELTLPDRNLVRRIMLDTFDQDLLQFGTKDFIKHIKIIEKEEGDVLVPESKQFYMVLLGAVRVKCGMMEYQRAQGEVFGQLQLLSQVKIDQIIFVQNSLLLFIDDQSFKTFFYQKYFLKYDNLQKEINCLQQFLIKVPPICRYTLLSKVERRVYQFGEKIVMKGENVDRIIVVGDKLKEEQVKYIVKGTIGLYQLKKNKIAYEQSIYSPAHNLQLLSIKINDFHQYITLQNSDSLMKSSFIFMDKSFANSTITQTDNPQGKQKIANFMRIRKVKLISEKRSKTEPRSLPIHNEFRFLKLDCLGVDFRCNESKIKARYKFKNSVTPAKKQKEYFR